MAAKKYRMLKAGEVVLPTDQVYVGAPVNRWLCGSLNCGKELPAKYEGGYRRLDTKEAGQTVRAKRPVQQRKACNNAVEVQCLRCGIWFYNIDGCPNGCRAGVTTAIA